MKALLLAVGLVAGVPLASATTIIEAPTSTLGTNFLINAAATGGSDLDSSGSPEALNLSRNLGPFTPGSGGTDISITGLAFGMPGAGNTNGNVITATITYLGADGVFGGGDDVVLGSVSDTLQFTTGAGVYSWAFDTPIAGTIDGVNSQFRIRLESDTALNGGNSNNIRLKSTGGGAGAKLSVAGTAVPNNPGGPGGDGILYSSYVIGNGALAPTSETLFSDRAGVGGNDSSTYATGAVPFALQYAGLWNVGASVTLTGMALPLRSPTDAGTLTFDFYDPGFDESFSGTGSEILLGSTTGTLQASLGGADAYYVNFVTPVSFTSLGTSVVVHVNSNASIRFKVTTETGASAGTGAQAYRVNAATGAAYTSNPVMKTSLAGTASGGTPIVTNTAPGSGNWDEVAWQSSAGGTITGGLNDQDTAVIGQYRAITYRGIPADEIIGTLNLGQDITNMGQGILNVDSGTLTVNGNLSAGRSTSANDSFLHANGGTLSIGGNADFGRSAEGCDGSLIVNGGAVEVGGNLALGGFEQGGSMLRFHNPGSAPAVDVGGSLILGRCSLDLTFDGGYTHVPGTTISLVTFANRTGQFLNFRNNQVFNCGPNRFRIEYLTNSIQIVALDNWTASSSSQPNIILLFTDDQGYADLRLHGDARYPMPELETLASNGARFTNAYVSAGVCHPSRAGLITGISQQRFGIGGNLPSSAPSHDGMATAQQTVPRRLQGLGYRTYGIGKWHLGDTVEFHPNCRGFDQWYGMWSGGRSYWTVATEGTIFQDQMTPDFASEDGTYITDRIGNKAVDFIDSHLASSSDPFFMYVSFTAVHAPVDIDSPPSGQPTDPRYARLSSEFDLDASDYLNSPRLYGQAQATVDKNRYDLAAMTLALDENIGKIVTRLSATPGLLENTMIVYLNDNGGAGYSAGFGGNYSYNNPLQGIKGGNMRDGSIKVPCIVSWPNGLNGGQVITTPITSLDFGATFVNAAGDAPAQARNGLDGLDLMPLLNNGTPLPAERALTWRMGGVTGGGSAIRVGDWKLWINDPGGSPRLYDLSNDIDESNDLSGLPANAGMVDELLNRFLSWEASTVPPLYGASGTLLDTGLERHPFAGGLRLKRDAASLAWLSAPFRNTLPLNEDFHLRFLARPTEATFGTDAELAYGLGDSTDRAQLIRAVIDYGNSQIRLENGRSANVVTAAMVSTPVGFSEAMLDFDAATNQLTFRFGGAVATLLLDGGYGAISQYAFGAAGMEGELSTLVPTAGGALGDAQSEGAGLVGPGLFGFDVRFVGEPPFAPVPQRSADLNGFSDDSAALIENLGGGLYQMTYPTTPGATREFFRLRLDQPR
ncbi:MAG: sulfatase-like hydrolase/transferase [Akkermansiaceae bacterium]